MVDFNKLREIKRLQSIPDKHPIVGRKARATRRHYLEVMAEVEAKKLLKPGQRFMRIIAPQSKRFQHNVEPN